MENLRWRSSCYILVIFLKVVYFNLFCKKKIQPKIKSVQAWCQVTKAHIWGWCANYHYLVSYWVLMLLTKHIRWAFYVNLHFLSNLISYNIYVSLLLKINVIEHKIFKIHTLNITNLNMVELVYQGTSIFIIPLTAGSFEILVILQFCIITWITNAIEPYISL